MGEFTDTLRRASVVPGPTPRPGPARPAPQAQPQPPRPVQAIASDKSGDWMARAVLVEPLSSVAEQFRHAAIRVRQEMQRRQPNVLLVTSAEPGAGKTMTASNLALALATISGGERVALVDLDLRRPSIGRAWGLDAKLGIDSSLASGTDPAEVAIGTDLAALDVFPAVAPIRAAHEALAGNLVDTMFKTLTGRYDIVICDTPPVLPVPDVPLLAKHAGGCLLVARAGSTRRREFRKLFEHIPRSKIVGVFLTEAPTNPAPYVYSRDESD